MLVIGSKHFGQKYGKLDDVAHATMIESNLPPSTFTLIRRHKESHKDTKKNSSASRVCNTLGVVEY